MGVLSESWASRSAGPCSSCLPAYGLTTVHESSCLAHPATGYSHPCSLPTTPLLPPPPMNPRGAARAIRPQSRATSTNCWKNLATPTAPGTRTDTARNRSSEHPARGFGFRKRPRPRPVRYLLQLALDLEGERLEAVGGAPAPHGRCRREVIAGGGGGPAN